MSRKLTAAVVAFVAVVGAALFTAWDIPLREWHPAMRLSLAVAAIYFAAAAYDLTEGRR